MEIPTSAPLQTTPSTVQRVAPESTSMATGV
jgi:hypothetical protein